MVTTPEQIDFWRRSASEHQRLEFKEAKAQFDNRKLYEYCVALANEGGGYLVLGVADAPPRPVVGTQAFNDPVAMAEKLFQAVGFRVDIEEVAHRDGTRFAGSVPYCWRSDWTISPISRAKHHEWSYTPAHRSWKPGSIM